MCYVSVTDTFINKGFSQTVTLHVHNLPPYFVMLLSPNLEKVQSKAFLSAKNLLMSSLFMINVIHYKLILVSKELPDFKGCWTPIGDTLFPSELFLIGY